MTLADVKKDIAVYTEEEESGASHVTSPFPVQPRTS